MRILFLSSLYPPATRGGGELSTHFIAQGLVERGHQVSVITTAPKQPGSEPAGRIGKLDGVSITRLPLPLNAKPLFEERHSKRMARHLLPYIHPESYDIIHAHDFRTALALAHLSLPQALVTARDYAQICGSTNNIAANGERCPGCTWTTVWQNHRVAEASLWRKPFRAWQFAHNIEWRHRAFRTYRHQIFISQAQLAEIARQQNLSETKTHVIYNPVSPQFLTTPLKPSRTRDLLFVGTVEKYKGVELLLNAFHALAQKEPDVHLKIVGDGHDRATYEKLVGSLGLQYRVTFTGRVPFTELLPIYDAAAIVVAPHLWIEPFGRTVIEAMARGKIAVAANTGGPAEIIKPGLTGLLFEHGNVASLVATLQKAVSLKPLDYREMATAARQWVEEHLKPSHSAAQHEQVYQQILIERP